MEPKPFRTEIEAAIAYLIGKGAIKSSSDVAKALGLNRSTVSNYATGKIPVSESFKTMFEDQYEIKLKDFDVSSDFKGVKNNNGVTHNKDLKDEMIALQRKQIELHEKYAALLERGQSNLNVILELVKGHGAHIHALYDRMPKHLSVTEGIPEKQAADELGSLLIKHLNREE